MTAQGNSSLISSARSFSSVASAVVILIGCLVLVGWILDIAALQSVLPGLVTMRANTALAFMLAGVSLWLLRAEQAAQQRRRIAQGCACIVALVGLLTLGEYLSGWDFGIDQLLFREPSGAIGTSSPGRMAPTTALTFLLLGLVLLLLDVKTRFGYRPVQFLTLTVALISLLALVGYLYEVTSYGRGSYTQMALHTAAALLLLCGGLLCARPHRGLMALFTSEGVGGVMVRHLLLPAIGIPLVMGWLRLTGQRAGLYETEFGLALMVVSSSIIFTVLVWSNARSLERADTERKRTEEALRASQTMFQSLFEFAPDAVVVVNREGRIVRVNAQAEKIFGYNRAELQDQSLEILLPERFRRVHVGHRTGYFSAPHTRVMGSGLELTSLRKDGSELPVEVSLSPVATEQGTLVMSIIRDITERKRAEEALQRSEQLYRTLIDNIHDGVFVIRDGKMQFANEAFATMIGYTVEEVSGKDFRALVAPEDREIVADRYRRRQAGEDIPRGYEFRMLHKDQTTRVMVDMNTALISSRGKVATMGTVQDITKRKRAEEMLQQEAQIAAALAHVGQDLIASLDTPTILDHLCRLTTEVLGCDCTHTVLWQPEREAFVPVAGYGDTPEQWETLRVATIPRETVSELLTHLEHEEVMQVVTMAHPELLPAAFFLQAGVTLGLWVPLRWGGEIIRGLSAGYRGRGKSLLPPNKSVSPGGWHILASLVLNNAQLLEQAESANRLKTDFLATMSHELRTPLNIIMGYTDLLLEGDFGSLPPEQTNFLQRVRKAADEELELIIAMLDLSRLEAGRLPVEIREANIAELLDEIATETQELLREKPRLSFTWQVTPDAPLFYTDRMKLKVVLKNLFSNAVKFTDEGSITLAACARDEGMEFCVTDTGIGIAPQIRPVLFEMFRQGEGSLTRGYGGVGLGLYIVRRLLELLGGTVTVESEVGRGSTFRVWVPQADTSQPA